MQIIGILILTITFIIIICLVYYKLVDLKYLIAFAGIAILIGAIFLLFDRITGVKIPAVGEISTAVAQATSDAKLISNIRIDIENQRDSLEMVVRDANNVHKKIMDLQILFDKAVERLHEIERIQSDANSILGNLRDLSLFSHTLILAENDNRDAFDKILEIATISGLFQKAALEGIEQIVQDVDPMLQVRIDPEVPWDNYGVTLDRSTLEQLRQVYPKLKNLHKLKYLSEVWKQERFPKYERLDFLAEVIKSESSLRALHRACVLMNMEAHLNKNILGAPMYLDWWRDNKSKYQANQ